MTKHGKFGKLKEFYFYIMNCRGIARTDMAKVSPTLLYKDLNTGNSIDIFLGFHILYGYIMYYFYDCRFLEGSGASFTLHLIATAIRPSSSASQWILTFDSSVVSLVIQAL